MPKCEICGKEMANPDSLGHINSKFHQDALLGGKAVDINLEPVKVPKPAPKKEEPKPVLNKVEPKKEEPKPTPRQEVKKVEVKPSEPKKEPPKPEPKKETKPKVKTGGGAKGKLNGFQAKLKRIGYNDIFDDIAMIVGIWGILITLINLFVNMVPFITGLQGWGAPPVMFATAFADILYYIIQLFMYSTLAIFPIYIKQVGMKIVKKWPDSRLCFIRTEEDYRNFFLLIRYLCIFLFMFSAWTWYWSHAVSFFAMTPVMLSGTIRKKLM